MPRSGTCMQSWRVLIRVQHRKTRRRSDTVNVVVFTGGNYVEMLARPFTWGQFLCIHAICPGGTEKSQNFDPSKHVPTGLHFSRKICFVPESLWPVKCTAFSDFWTGQIALHSRVTQVMNTVSTWHLYTPVVAKCLDSTLRERNAIDF